MAAAAVALVIPKFDSPLFSFHYHRRSAKRLVLEPLFLRDALTNNFNVSQVTCSQLALDGMRVEELKCRRRMESCFSVDCDHKCMAV